MLNKLGSPVSQGFTVFAFGNTIGYIASNSVQKVWKGRREFFRDQGLITWILDILHKIHEDMSWGTELWVCIYLFVGLDSPEKC